MEVTTHKDTQSQSSPVAAVYPSVSALPASNSDLLHPDRYYVGPIGIEYRLFATPGSSLDRLHMIAERVGIRRQQFRHNGTFMPHYGIRFQSVRLAILYGATRLTAEEAEAVRRAWSSDAKTMTIAGEEQRVSGT
jgi:hypothetical protein